MSYSLSAACDADQGAARALSWLSCRIGALDSGSRALLPAVGVVEGGAGAGKTTLLRSLSRPVSAVEDGA